MAEKKRSTFEVAEGRAEFEHHSLILNCKVLFSPLLSPQSEWINEEVRFTEQTRKEGKVGKSLW